MLFSDYDIAVTSRSFNEYLDMFNLEGDQILNQGPILDVAAGTSSFTAEANESGLNCTAVDPIYSLDPLQIYNIAEKELVTTMSKILPIKERFGWRYYQSTDNFRKIRQESLERFKLDFNPQKSSYISGTFPYLPFSDDHFSLVLSSHFLFIYGERKSQNKHSFDFEFHKQSILELLRITKKGGQIRLFPLNTSKWVIYPHLENLLEELNLFSSSIEVVSSEIDFIPGSNQLLKITK